MDGDVEERSSLVRVRVCEFDAVMCSVHVVAEVNDVVWMVVVEGYDVIHVSEKFERLVWKGCYVLVPEVCHKYVGV